MKEKIYTIPINDALDAHDECPFCFIERKVEQDQLDFVLGHGASYMERDIRDITDKYGFCREHFKKMFLYQNALGNAWILKTHYKKTIEEMTKEIKSYKPGKTSLMSKFSKGGSDVNPVTAWTRGREKSCYICKIFNESYDRYMDTFIEMYKTEPEFVEKVKNCKGFCLTHFGDVIDMADRKMNEQEKNEFYDMISSLQLENMKRLEEDVSWMIEKYDYRNKDADWKNSKDAVQRGMQKLKGGYPADEDYRMKK